MEGTIIPLFCLQSKIKISVWLYLPVICRAFLLLLQFISLDTLSKSGLSI